MVIFKSLFRISCFFIKFQPFVCRGEPTALGLWEEPSTVLLITCNRPWFSCSWDVLIPTRITLSPALSPAFIVSFYRQLLSSAFIVSFFRRLPSAASAVTIPSLFSYKQSYHIREQIIGKQFHFCLSAVLPFWLFVFRFSSFVFRWAAALDDEQDADQIAVFPFCGRNFHLPPLVRLNWYLISTNI